MPERVRRSETLVNIVPSTCCRELTDGFLVGVSRVWEKLENLLKNCEGYICKAADRQNVKNISKSAATEFVGEPPKLCATTMAENQGNRTKFVRLDDTLLQVQDDLHQFSHPQTE